MIREFTEDDLETFFVLGSDPDITRYTHDPGGGFRDHAEALEVMRTRPIGDYEKYGYGRWACVEKDTGEVVGFNGVKYLEEDDFVDLGYRFLKDRWGRGYATESSRAIVDHAFGVLGIPQLVGSVLPDNTGSVRVLEKLGFRYWQTVEDDGLEVVQYVLEPPSE